MNFRKVSFEQYKKDCESIGKNINWENYNQIIIPSRGTIKSAGYDISCPIDILVKANGIVKFPTGLCSAGMPNNVVLLIFPRSSTGIKKKLSLSNTIGIIDSDYSNSENEGEIWISLHNDEDVEKNIKQGEFLFQGIFMNYILVDGDNFNHGKDRNGGIGSTKM